MQTKTFETLPSGKLKKDFPITIDISPSEKIQGILDGEYDSHDMDSILTNISSCINIARNVTFLTKGNKITCTFYTFDTFTIEIAQGHNFSLLSLETTAIVKDYKTLFKIRFAKGTTLYNDIVRKIEEATVVKAKRNSPKWKNRALANTCIVNALKEHHRDVVSL